MLFKRIFALCIAFVAAASLLASCGKQDIVEEANKLLAEGKNEEAYCLLITAEDSDDRISDMLAKFKVVFAVRENIYMSADELQVTRYEDIYDSNGNKLKTLHTDYNGTQTTPFQAEYDENGRIISEVYRQNGEIKWENSYEYDENGRIISEGYRHNGEIKWKYSYEYDENGNNIKTVLIRDNKYTTYEYNYDENGNLINELRLDPADKIVEKTVYTYDKNGNRIRSLNIVNGNESHSYDFVYGNNGKIVKNTYTTYDDDPDGIVNWSIEYTYDENGNEIKRKTAYSGGKVRVIESKFNENGKRTEQTETVSGDIETRLLMSYDENGNVIRSERSTSGGITEIYEYTYNSDGINTKTIRKVKEADNAAVITSVVIYRYDENRNNVKEIHLKTGGGIVVYKKSNYQYFYYPDGVPEE
ncbi:MAG: hypothetical protein E7595_05760 [Ruminococcaceae bacterium]|nr:hypothetical protein [Oscillospiraceae bacterium]